jgi:hypothetical protein
MLVRVSRLLLFVVPLSLSAPLRATAADAGVKPAAAKTPDAGAKPAPRRRPTRRRCARACTGRHHHEVRQEGEGAQDAEAAKKSARRPLHGEPQGDVLAAPA